MKFAKPVLITFSALLLAACSNSGPTANSTPVPRSAASPAATPDQFAAAKAHYSKHCSACHGDEGKGGTVKVDNVKLKVPSLREGHAVNHTDEQLAKQITNGGDGMPKFKDKLNATEISDLVRFIRHDFQGK